MTDAAHYFGNDLTIAANGDLLMASAPTETTQRILRRLLTANLAYIWQPAYGAGLPSQIGTPTSLIHVQNAIRAQIFQESNVAAAPEPTVTLTSNAGGTFTATISYTEAASGTTQTLTVPVS